jgi:hypothetical protein
MAREVVAGWGGFGGSLPARDFALQSTAKAWHQAYERVMIALGVTTWCVGFVAKPLVIVDKGTPEEERFSEECFFAAMWETWRPAPQLDAATAPKACNTMHYHTPSEVYKHLHKSVGKGKCSKTSIQDSNSPLLPPCHHKTEHTHNAAPPQQRSQP